MSRNKFENTNEIQKKHLSKFKILLDNFKSDKNSSFSNQDRIIAIQLLQDIYTILENQANTPISNVDENKLKDEIQIIHKNLKSLEDKTTLYPQDQLMQAQQNLNNFKSLIEHVLELSRNKIKTQKLERELQKRLATGTTSLTDTLSDTDNTSNESDINTSPTATPSKEAGRVPNLKELLKFQVNPDLIRAKYSPVEESDDDSWSDSLKTSSQSSGSTQASSLTSSDRSTTTSSNQSPTGSSNQSTTTSSNQSPTGSSKQSPAASPTSSTSSSPTPVSRSGQTSPEITEQKRKNDFQEARRKLSVFMSGKQPKSTPTATLETKSTKDNIPDLILLGILGNNYNKFAQLKSLKSQNLYTNPMLDNLEIMITTFKNNFKEFYEKNKEKVFSKASSNIGDIRTEYFEYLKKDNPSLHNYLTKWGKTNLDLLIESAGNLLKPATAETKVEEEKTKSDQAPKPIRFSTTSTSQAQSDKHLPKPPNRDDTHRPK